MGNPTDLSPDASSVTTVQPTGSPVATQTPAAPVANAPAITPGLEKFYKDGKLDSEGLAKSYLEAEKTMRVSQSELAKAKEAMAAITVSGGATPQSITTPQPTNQPVKTAQEQLAEFVANPEQFVAGILENVSAPLAEQLTQSAFHTKHPEMKDPEYSGKVKTWLTKLPPDVQALEHTLDGADWLMTMYKRESGLPITSGAAAAPKTETPSSSGAANSSTGKLFSREKIRNLRTSSPAEYARLEPEIAAAYREGRVVA
jgi:hypothetical protein